MADWVRAKDVPEAAPFFVEEPLGRNTPASTPQADPGAGSVEAGTFRSTTPGQNRAAPRAMQDFGMPQSQESAPAPQDGFDRAEQAAPESAGPPGADSAADLQQWASSELDHPPEDRPLVQGAPQQQVLSHTGRG